MNALRRALYLQAAVWALAGLALAVAPRFVLVRVFGQPPLSEFSWMRIVGILAFGLALLMVLVGHRVEDLWWWAWAFCLTTVGLAVTGLLNAGFGIRPRQSAAFWWAFSGLAVAFSAALLWGIYVTSRERPPE